MGSLFVPVSQEVGDGYILSIKMYLTSGVDPGFPIVGGANTILPKFPENLMNFETYLAVGARSLDPPIPLISWVVM